MDQHSPTYFFANTPDYEHSRFGRALAFEKDFDELFVSPEGPYDMPYIDDLKPVTKTIQKRLFDKRNYMVISNEIRLQLIEAVQKHGEKIKFAAQRLGINYSSAKAIWQIYKREGRSHKKMPAKAKEILKSQSLACDSASTSDTNKTPVNRNENVTTTACETSTSQVKNAVCEQPFFLQHQPQSIKIVPIQPIYQLTPSSFPTSILNHQTNSINPATLNQNIPTKCVQLSNPNMSYGLTVNNQPNYSSFYGQFNPQVDDKSRQGFFTVVNHNQMCPVPMQGIRVMLVPVSQLSSSYGSYRNYCN